jgi:hypothetical protein
MAQATMYPAKINSPLTSIASDITAVATSITLADASVLPAAPNLAVLGTGDDAETILYTDITDNVLTVTRAFQGTAAAWDAGTPVARYFTAYDADTFADNIEDLAARPSQSMERQAIIDGNFQIAQRAAGAAYAAPPNVSYPVFDLWKAYYAVDGGTPPSITHSQGIITPGDLDKSSFCYKISVDGAGSSYGNSSYYTLLHYVENGVRNLCGDGKKVTLSFWARSTIANKRLGFSLHQNYGTGGSPSSASEYSGTNWTLTSTWTKYTQTIDTTSLAGKTFGTDRNDYLRLTFWLQWGSSLAGQPGASTAETWVGAGDIEIAQIQLCAGDTALPFEPKSFGEELRACQRFYEKSYNYSTAVGTSGVTAGAIILAVGATTIGHGWLYGYVSYMQTKRISVTPIIYPITTPTNTMRVSTVSGQTDQAATSGGAISGSNNFTVINNSGGAISPPAQGGILFHYTADARF